MKAPIDPAAFVVAETRVGTASLVPEFRLHLADAALPLWQATEDQLIETYLPPPYWAFAWPGGQALARLLLDQPEWARGKRIVDFGAGCGIASLAAMRSGAAEVTAVDIDRFALAAIALNADLNGLSLNVSAALPSTMGCDLLLFGDMCYERPLAEAVMGWAHGGRAAGAIVLIADPGRAYRPTENYTEIARYVVPTSLDLEDRETRETIVWRLAAPPA